MDKKADSDEISSETDSSSSEEESNEKKQEEDEDAYGPTLGQTTVEQAPEIPQETVEPMEANFGEQEEDGNNEEYQKYLEMMSKVDDKEQEEIESKL